MAPAKIQGDATDTAILRFTDGLSNASVTREHFTTLFTQNFNSSTKYMLKVVAHSPSISHAEQAAMPVLDGHHILLVKGAPDVLLQRSTHVYDPASGQSLPLSSENLAAIVKVQERWSSQGQRVLLLARKHIPIGEEGPETTAFSDRVIRSVNDLEVVGLVGILDPPQDGVKESIQICRKAGIRVFMVTGDFKLTAAAIAEKCGIISDVNRVHGFKDMFDDTKSDFTDEKEGHNEAKSAIRTFKHQSLVLEGADIVSCSCSCT
jgi:sodium/potassium-transporting ATPase subunit alpha